MFKKIDSGVSAGVVITTSPTGGLPVIVVGTLMHCVAFAHQVQTPSYMWVYVFRRGRPNNILHPRDRWCGPRVIVLVSQRGIYVAMRSRLWRCGPEPLRPAHLNEMSGAQMSEGPAWAELLQKINSGVRAGILDVSTERPPQPSQEFAPVARDDEGIFLGTSGPSIRPQEVRQLRNDFYPSMPRPTEDPIRKKFYSWTTHPAPERSKDSRRSSVEESLFCLPEGFAIGNQGAGHSCWTTAASYPASHFGERIFFLYGGSGFGIFSSCFHSWRTGSSHRQGRARRCRV